MTKKTKKAEVKDPNELSVLKLSSADLDHLSRWDAEVRAANALLLLRQNELEIVSEKIDPQGILRAAQQAFRAARASADTTKARYLEVSKEIGSKMNVNMAEYAYDDETGVLNKLPDDVAGAAKKD